jgi:hypothetical protein
MVSRNAPRKTPAPAGRLVPTLRDAVDVVDRALEELGQPPATKKKRAGPRKPRKA